MTALSIAYALITMGLGMTLLLRPYMILRPTIWFALVMTFIINGAAAIAPDHYYINLNELSYGYVWITELRWLSVLFPLCLMLVAHITPHLNSLAKYLYGHCRFTSQMPQVYLWGKEEKTLTFFLLGAIAIVLGIYSIHVPLNQTGLWAIFFDPANAATAREESLKLVSSSFVRYGYRWHRALFAPMLLGLLFLWKRRWFDLRTVVFFLVAPVLVLTVMFYGSRSAAGLMLIFLGIIFMLRRGLLRGAISLGGLSMATLMIASVLTIFRTGFGEGIYLGLLFQYMLGSIFRRALILPFHTGVLYNVYAEENGLLMGSGIRPLAFLLGMDYVPISNIIGQLYIPGALFSVISNTCSLFDFQANFGLLGGYLLSLFSLFLLDHFLYAFRRLKGLLLVVFLAVFLLTCFNSVITALTVALNTGGILWVTVLAWLVGQATMKRRAFRIDPGEGVLHPVGQGKVK